jgi:hypothetical protein
LQAADAIKRTVGQPEPAGVLQLEDPGFESALAVFDQDPAARRLQLLAADRALVDSLMLQGYAGPEWIRFTRALAEYGYPVMRAWVFTGAIFLRCAEKGIGRLPRTNTTFDGTDAAEIAGETVAEAIKHFRDRVLIPGRWDMTRGASLNTFFVGQCILRFPNVYRRWYREGRDQLLARSDLAALEVDLSMKTGFKAAKTRMSGIDGSYVDSIRWTHDDRFGREVAKEDQVVEINDEDESSFVYPHGPVLNVRRLRASKTRYVYLELPDRHHTIAWSDFRAALRTEGLKLPKSVISRAVPSAFADIVLRWTNLGG